MRLRKVQSKIIFRAIKKNKRTIFGLKHGFASIKTIEDYQRKVPISVFDDYIEYVRDIEDAKPAVLTEEKVLRLIPTSGSASASKAIPFTRSLKREFQRGIRPWIFDMYINRPKLWPGKIYWSITPSALGLRERANRSIAVGFGDDSDYFSIIEKALLKFLLVVPEEINKIQDIQSFRYVTLLFLLSKRNLRFMSVWNPMFLILILNNLTHWFPGLLRDLQNATINPPVDIAWQLKTRLERKLKISAQRIKELRQIYKRWRLDKDIPICRMIWPELTLISCWADSNAGHFIGQLKKIFPDVEIQPKGLIATEGFVSLPLTPASGGDSGRGLLAVNSHFFEFMEVDKYIEPGGNSKLKLAHELEVGKKYTVVLTTGGGLYRYNLQDIIEVVSFRGKVAVVRFLGKHDYVSDFLGEKLNAFHVEKVLKPLFVKYGIFPEFYMMAPEEYGQNIFAYTLFIKIKDCSRDLLMKFVKDADSSLAENIHYRYCRKLQQLKHLRLFIVEPGASVVECYLFRKVCCDGQRLGNVKVPLLENNLGWTKVFPGRLFCA
ncbi:MAG: GH3 auxin-responsive promoter family protein [Candidatus Omnitrophica bacterium]|nr:GH3 auxin-responsive promoter family protein [Candidatus Omnitrophota bacterium]